MTTRVMPWHSRVQFRDSACPDCGAPTFTLASRPAGEAAMCSQCAAEAAPAPTALDLFRPHGAALGVDCDTADLGQLPDVMTRMVLTDGVRAAAAEERRPFRALLAGPTGAGKTHALVAVGRALAETGKLVGADFVIGTENSLLVPRDGDFGRRDVATTVGSAKVVLVDEWGRGRFARGTADAFRIDLLELVESRGLSLVICTNLSLDQFPDQFPDGDPAMWSRLAALVGGEVMYPGEVRGQQVVDQRTSRYH